MKRWCRVLTGCLGAVLFLAAAASHPVGDPRLEQRVTLKLGLVTLEKFAEEVSQQTGVTFEVGRDERDWQVRERKTVVFAKDVPAKEILAQVAELHHYLLSGYGKGKDRYYCIWQDLKARREEEKLREQAKPKPLEEYTSAVNELASLYGPQEDMTEDELAQLEKDDPYKHFLLTDPVGQAICGIAAQLPSDACSSIGSGLSYRIEPVSPALAAAIRRFAEECWMLNPEHERDDEFDENRIRLDVTHEDGSLGYWMRKSGTLGQFELHGFEISIVRPGSPAREAWGTLLKARRAGIDTRGRTTHEMRRQLGIPKPELLNRDPILKERVKIDAKDGRDYAAWLGGIHEKTGLTVLSDSYWEQIGSGLSGEVSVRDILETVGFLDKTPSKEDSALVISDNLWYGKRPAQIPDYYLEYYTEKAKTSGLSLDDLKQIALDLTDGQINKNLLLREVFEEYRFSLGTSRSLAGMRLLTLLTPEQISAITLRPEMFEERMEWPRGLPVEDLPPDALKYALQMFGKDMGDLQGKRVTISSYRQVKYGGGRQGFNLTVSILDEQGTRDSSSAEIWYPAPKPPKDEKEQPPDTPKNDGQ